ISPSRAAVWAARFRRNAMDSRRAGLRLRPSPDLLLFAVYAITHHHLRAIAAAITLLISLDDIHHVLRRAVVDAARGAAVAGANLFAIERMPVNGNGEPVNRLDIVGRPTE